MELAITFDLLPILAVLFSILAMIIPKFKDWFEKLESEKKQLFMTGLLFLVGLGATLLSYFGFLDIYAFDTWQSWVWYPLVDVIAAIMANAGIYKATNYMLGP